MPLSARTSLRALVAAVVALLLVLAPIAPAQAATTPSDLDQQVADALHEVNKIRTAKGKPALKLMCPLNSVAQAWSAKQANANTMSHNPSYTSQIPSGWKRAGETVAAGYSSFVGAVQGWKGSGPHYEIMMGDYTHVGFGMAISSTGKKYYTANFAKYTTSTSGYCEPVNDGSLPTRIAGVDRYTTASYIASVWDWDHDANIVFVATGENYPDALSAAAAAARLGAPVVLTPKKSLPAEVRSRIRELDPDKIVVLGSTSAVSSSVLSSLSKIVGTSNVTRIGGSDRYDTMRRIVRYAWDDHAGGLEPAPAVVIATGGNFPDALSAGPAVATVGGAVILVDGKKSSIPTATLKLIAELDPQSVVIAGGPSAVSSDILRQLSGNYPGMVVRIAGADRYDTSRRIVDHFFDTEPTAFFATGKNFPDALAGAALAGALGSPLFVTQPQCVSSKTRSLVLSLGASERVLLGGSSVLSSSVRSLKVC